MSSSGSAKESSSVSESSGSSASSSYGMSSSESHSDSASSSEANSSGSSQRGSSSDEVPESSSEDVYVPPGDESSGSSSSSSSCQCDFEVSEITLTGGMEGSYVVTNTGCGPLEITGHSASGAASWEPMATHLEENESTTVFIHAEGDIRLTRFEVLTDCKTKFYEWPDWP